MLTEAANDYFSLGWLSMP